MAIENETKTTTRRGWWRLKTDGIANMDLTSATQEHIASLIQQGFTEGEIIQEQEEA